MNFAPNGIVRFWVMDGKPVDELELISTIG